MVSLGVCRALKSVAAVIASLVFVASSLLPSAGAAESDAQHDRLQNQVQEILSRDGPYSLALLEPLTGLGQLYQSEDDQILALATLERAVQIVRINNGLHTLNQIPLIRQLIRIEEGIGNDAGAWEREQKLLTLLRRHLDDLRTVPVLREIADKQMDVLAKVLAGKRPAQVVLGCFYQEFPNRDGANCRAGSRRTVVQGMLAEAQRNYADAIGVMLRNGLYDSDELRDLELRVLNGVDLVRSINHASRGYPVPMVPPQINASSLERWRSRMAPIAALAEWERPSSSGSESSEYRESSNFHLRHIEMMDPYQRGRQSLQRLYEYSAASSSPPLRQADAVVQLADWDLLHSRNGQALDTYTETYAELAKAGLAQASIAQLFAPATPVVLPAFK